MIEHVGEKICSTLINFTVLEISAQTMLGQIRTPQNLEKMMNKKLRLCSAYSMRLLKMPNLLDINIL